MALRLSTGLDVIVGSREAEKAISACEASIAAIGQRGLSCSLKGVTNQDAVDEADIVVLALPYKHLVSTLQSLSGFEDKIVITPVNPIERSTHFYYAPPPEGSAAMLVRKMMPESTAVCAAFNNIAANRWKVLDEVLDYSVAVCGDDPDAKQQVMDLVNSISQLRAYDAGPLAASSLVESVTPLLLNIARFNRIKDAGIRFI